jgi:RND family efflux transporter MFP subunit
MFYSCGDTEENIENKEKLPVVKVRPIEVQTFTESYNIVGVVKPYDEATLSSEEGGLITFLRVDKGDRVGRGQTIARLKKDVDYASYEQSLAQYELAKSSFERVESLFLDDVATEQEYTDAKLNLDIAEKTVKVYRRRLSKSVVRSPISGVVDEKFMFRGEVSSPGAPIVKIVDVSRVKISAGIPERYINDVTKGSKVVITFDILPGKEYEGTVNYVSPTLSKINRTFEIEVVLNNSDRKLKPEMSANVQVTRFNVDNAVVLSQDLVVDFGEEKYLFILENDVAKKRIITLGARNGNNLLIESGLNPGDKLIFEGYQSLVDGDKVKVIK